MRRRALIGGSASLGALAWAAACVYVYWQAFGRRSPELRRLTPEDFGVRHESLEVHTADGIRLAAWYMPGTTEAAVVVSGGYRGHVSDVLGISTALNKAGFHVVAYGWRGTPGSDSAAHTLGVYERQDLVAVLDALEARLGRVPIGLLGYSLGGAVSISVGATDPRVAAVCTDSAFADPAGIVVEKIRRAFRLPAVVFWTPVMAVFATRTGARISDFRPLAVVADLAPRPLLLIHGEADSSVPFAHAQRLFDAAGEPRQIWLLPGVEHVGGYFADRTAYIHRVIDFFLTAMAPAKAAARA